ncbi:MAG: pyridoxamine 5'-phosphate oxidase family protein [Deltaproteobacteria bacterium]|jgi:nitroimidazol reductase NimA-like FMN-containing flavoprotein (pyridoxamine 5'-phosphate oxidase superfamily)|nr:pyridoxamine 5'-phosphate oxidase family protein [Deltaproteobacteria bacterium]
MQPVPRKGLLSPEECLAVLKECPVACLATLGPDGEPCVTPVHFAAADGVLYVHGGKEASRHRNVARDPRVSLSAYLGGALCHADGPCDTMTFYRSVSVTGTARMVTDSAGRSAALDALVLKYTPRHAGKPYPEDALEITAVMAVVPSSVTGKSFS